MRRQHYGTSFIATRRKIPGFSDGEMSKEMVKKISMSLAVLMLLAVGCTVQVYAQEVPYTLHIEQRGEEGVVTGYSGVLPAVLEIPAGISVIGEEAFLDAPDLETVILPEGVREIQTAAFMNCLQLVSVSFPSTLKIIGMGAFCQCGALAEIDLPEAVEQIGMGAFGACELLEEVVIPPKVRLLSGTVFSYCSNLKRVHLPEGLERIGASAFGNCTSLAELQLPSSLRSVEDAAFKSCTSLKRLDIPEGPTYLSFTFDNCTSLTHLTIPRSVTMIEGSVFRRCDALEEVRYGGTREAWNKALSYGNSSLSSKVTLVCAADDPGRPDNPPPAEVTAPALRTETGYTITQGADGDILTGISIGRTDDFTDVASVINAFDAPVGTAVVICDAQGNECELIAPAATGDIVRLYDSLGRVREVTIIIPGDVMGSGILNISQVVRLAQGMTGAVPLTGPYLAAGSLSGSGSVNIADLVALASMLTV